MMSPLLALQGVFAMNALALALWFPRIPDVRDALALDYNILSLALLGLPIGMMIGFVTAPRVVRALGQRRTCMIVGFGHPLLMIPPAFAPSVLMVGLSLLIAGLAMSNIEIAMNAKANAVQEANGQRIMSRCHGFWSLGAMAGALIGGWCARNGISFGAQQVMLEPLVGLFGLIFARALPADMAQAGTALKADRIGWPSGPLAMLCILPFGALMVEGVMLDWSVLFVRDVMGLGAFAGAVIFSVFAASMGLWRLAGDALTNRIGAHRLLILSGFALALGLLLFARAQNLWMAGGGVFIAGFGAANVYPLAISLSHHVPGRSGETNVATVALVAFTVFLIGPPLIGFIAAASDLSVAFLCLLPVAVISIPLVWFGLVGDAPERNDP